MDDRNSDEGLTGWPWGPPSWSSSFTLLDVGRLSERSANCLAKTYQPQWKASIATYLLYALDAYRVLAFNTCDHRLYIGFLGSDKSGL